MNASGLWHTLSTTQVDQIREAALAHLERQGFVVQDTELLARAKARGAQVNEASGCIQVPRALCAESLATLPNRYTIGNILGERWEIGGDSQYGVAIVTDPWIIDYHTREPRHPCLDDVRRHTIIAEQLEPVIAISRMDYPVTDVPGPASSLRALEIHLLNHTRHYTVMPTGPESFAQWLDILPILARGGESGHLLTLAVAVASPLVLNSINCALLKRGVERGFPIVPTVCPMAGSTAPYSHVGMLLQAHLEVLMVALL